MYHESNLGGGRYYSPKYSVLHENGLLTIKTSGWEDGATHWTGFFTVSPSEPDYQFWYWMALVKRADVSLSGAHFIPAQRTTRMYMVTSSG